jgi:hypothetical protein
MSGAKDGCLSIGSQMISTSTTKEGFIVSMEKDKYYPGMIGNVLLSKTALNSDVIATITVDNSPYSPWNITTTGTTSHSLGWSGTPDDTGLYYDLYPCGPTIRHIYPTVLQNQKEVCMKRLVRIMVVDRCEDVPADESILFQEEMFTELTDEEIWLSIGLEDALEKYNAKRILLLDKAISREQGRDVVLEPLRLKDVAKVITTLASF